MKKSVVVTGGSRGLGLAMVKSLAWQDYQVVAIARQPNPELDQTMRETDAIKLITWDLADLAKLTDLASTIKDVAGPVYGLVNNAGIGPTGILSTMSDSKIAQIVQLNVLSPITLTKYLVRPMLTARAGRIINIGSIVASTGYPGLSVYSASKAALIGFTHSLAREVGSLGITVNAVSPGFVDTDMTNELSVKQREQIKRRSALQRMVTADDVAAAVKFLMSDEAANITGTVITVDAGNTA